MPRVTARWRITFVAMLQLLVNSLCPGRYLAGSAGWLSFTGEMTDRSLWAHPPRMRTPTSPASCQRTGRSPMRPAGFGELGAHGIDQPRNVSSMLARIPT